MATGGNKKKKKKSGRPDFFIIGLLAIVGIIGIYMLITWDWPSHKQQDLIGRWYYDTSDLSIEASDGSYNSVSSVYYEFKDDGTWTLTNSSSGATSTGAYAIADKTLTFSFDSGAEPEPFAFIVKGDNLTLGEGDDTVVLSRVK